MANGYIIASKTFAVHDGTFCKRYYYFVQIHWEGTNMSSQCRACYCINQIRHSVSMYIVLNIQLHDCAIMLALFAMTYIYIYISQVEGDLILTTALTPHDTSTIPLWQLKSSSARAFMHLNDDGIIGLYAAASDDMTAATAQQLQLPLTTANSNTINSKDTPVVAVASVERSLQDTATVSKLLSGDHHRAPYNWTSPKRTYTLEVSQGGKNVLLYHSDTGNVVWQLNDVGPGSPVRQEIVNGSYVYADLIMNVSTASNLLVAHTTTHAVILVNSVLAMHSSMYALREVIAIRSYYAHTVLYLHCTCAAENWQS
jgi:hypothetical protein